MKRIAFSALACLALAACEVPQTQTATATQPHGSFVTINDLRAVSLPDGRFEIKGRPTKTKDAYWCAAGDFARRGLGLPWDAKIYVVRGIGAAETGGARSAVQFTTTPEQLGITPYEADVVTDVLTPGYSRAVNSARGYCLDRIFPPWLD